jgi:hypothetical protein
MPRSSRWAALVLAAAACKKAPPPPPAPARFCDQDLSGVWLNASDKHFAYRFRDRDGVVRGEFLVRSDDGVLANPAEQMTFELHRTKAALAGVMRTTQQTEGGRSCPVEFALEVTGCGESRLQAVVETDAPVNEECKRPTAEDGGVLETNRTEFVFVRDVGSSRGPEGEGRRPDSLHPSGGGEGPIDR